MLQNGNRHPFVPTHVPSDRRGPVSIPPFVTPAKAFTGNSVQHHPPNLDSGFRRNDGWVTPGTPSPFCSKIFAGYKNLQWIAMQSKGGQYGVHGKGQNKEFS